MSERVDPVFAAFEWKFCKDCRHLVGLSCHSPRITPDLVTGVRGYETASYMRQPSDARSSPLEDRRCGLSALWFDPMINEVKKGD